jgi:sugar/nucleoside kinase (ribokinase family)
MKTTTVETNSDFREREAEWAAQDRDREASKKNANFYQVYTERGSPTIRAMIDASPSAARVFLFVAETMDRENALVASQTALAEAVGISQAQVSRALSWLEERGHIARFKTGTSTVIVANPDLVWKAWANGKPAVVAKSKVLLSLKEQNAPVRRHGAMLIASKREAEASEAARQGTLELDAQVDPETGEIRSKETAA